MLHETEIVYQNLMALVIHNLFSEIIDILPQTKMMLTNLE
jgi:hypothetical protein